jgi:hypothetical protein
MEFMVLSLKRTLVTSHHTPVRVDFAIYPTFRTCLSKNDIYRREAMLLPKQGIERKIGLCVDPAADAPVSRLVGWLKQFHYILLSSRRRLEEKQHGT